MVRILHILPENGPGGAEIAALSALESVEGLHVHFLARSRSEGASGTSGTSGKRHARHSEGWRLLKMVRRINPDLIIYSLWKSLPALLVLRLCCPRRAHVLLLHSARPAHALDRIATALMVWLVREVWSDSENSLARLPAHVRKRARVVSFRLRSARPVTQERPAPNFIFWGRLTPMKGLDRVLRFFAGVLDQLPQARLTLVGPDCGVEPALRAQIANTPAEPQVTFLGSRSWDDITELARSHSFYIQFSSQEGMAMSVAEAMQLGLVPVVTPVGEIPSYCHDGIHGLHYTDDAATRDRLFALLENPPLFASFRAAAGQSAAEQQLYGESLLSCAIDLLSQNQPPGGIVRDIDQINQYNQTQETGDEKTK